MKIQIGIAALVWLTSCVTSSHGVGSDPDSKYGADVSFPIHHPWGEENGPNANNVYDNSASPAFLKQLRETYEEFMEGCRSYYGKKGNRCDSTETERLAMSLRQAQSMVNYTSTGFMKIKAPDKVRKLLADYWDKHKENQSEEHWPAGNIYTNHWAAPTYMVSVEDRSLDGGGQELKNAIWDAARDTLQKWTGMELQPTSLYGIRVYTEGAILNPHVDRLPLVSSCIVNVDQDVDEPWPLEVYDREGNAVNVTMEPGDMVLYESHSLIHGRPFPLKGRYYANIFIHFEPTGRPLYRDDIELYTAEDFPPYVVPGSPEDSHWRRQNPGGWKMPSPSAEKGVISGVPKGHSIAAAGDLNGLYELAKEERHMLEHADENGWQPIHEAARAGHREIVRLLIEDYGVDMNVRTHGGIGNSPLNIAIEHLSDKHPVSRYLQSVGARNLGPEL